MPLSFCGARSVFLINVAMTSSTGRANFESLVGDLYGRPSSFTLRHSRLIKCQFSLWSSSTLDLTHFCESGNSVLRHSRHRYVLGSRQTDSVEPLFVTLLRLNFGEIAKSSSVCTATKGSLKSLVICLCQFCDVSRFQPDSSPTSRFEWG